MHAFARPCRALLCAGFHRRRRPSHPPLSSSHRPHPRSTNEKPTTITTNNNPQTKKQRSTSSPSRCCRRCAGACSSCARPRATPTPRRASSWAAWWSTSRRGDCWGFRGLGGVGQGLGCAGETKGRGEGPGASLCARLRSPTVLRTPSHQKKQITDRPSAAAGASCLWPAARRTTRAWRRARRWRRCAR